MDPAPDFFTAFFSEPRRGAGYIIGDIRVIEQAPKDATL